MKKPRPTNLRPNVLKMLNVKNNKYANTWEYTVFLKEINFIGVLFVVVVDVVVVVVDVDVDVVVVE